MSGIQEIITACEWAPSYYLILSENVFSPLLYYSYFGSVIPCLLIGTFIFINGPRNLINRLLFITLLLFASWVFCALVLWATEFPSYTMFFWTVLNIIEPFVYFFAFYFVFVFTFKRDFTLIQKVLFTLPLLPTLAFGSTHLMLLGYNLADCDRNAYEGILATYDYIVEILYIFGIAIIGARVLFGRASFKGDRKQSLFVVLGTILFLLSFSAGNILEVFTENWYIGQYGLFGAPTFAAILAYLIVRFKSFNAKLVGTQALVVSLWLLSFSLLFIRTTENVRIVVIFTLILFSILGFILIRSVKKEIEQKQLAQQLATELAGANMHLERLDKMKSEFVSIASHQLRSPLTSIRGYLSMILEGSYGEVDPKQKEILEHVSDAARHMSLSVEDYLNVSRIESGHMKYELADVDLRQLAEDTVTEMLPVALKRGMAIIFRPKFDGPAIVKLDIGKAKQVVQNLIDNALKYTPEKGQITLTLRKGEGNKKIFLDVSDTGIGISPDDIKAIFDKFERAKNANSVNVTGTGLGLYIARQMARAMAGDITVSSEGEGKGTTFTISFNLNGIESKWSAKKG